MVTKLTYIESDQVNPYKNLAVEEYLLLHCKVFIWMKLTALNVSNLLYHMRSPYPILFNFFIFLLLHLRIMIQTHISIPDVLLPLPHPFL